MAVKKTFGFDLVKLVLVIIILGLAGYIGWSNWNSRHKTQAAISSASSQAQSASKKTAITPPTAGNKTFVFKELGAQIALPGSLSGMTYTVSELPGPNNAKVPVLNLTTPQLVATISTCTQKQPSGTSPGSFASLSRNDGKYPAGPTASGAGTLMKQFDNFYIIARYPSPTNCINASDAQTLQDEQKAAQDALTAAFKNAQVFSNSN